MCQCTKGNPMVDHREETFTSQTVHLDDNSFVQCTFANCYLVYSGGGPPTLISNNIDGCEFILEGAARRPLAYLGVLWLAGNEMRQIVQDFLDNSHCPSVFFNPAGQGQT